jgi:trehalose 6-phosphate phosphatase
MRGSRERLVEIEGARDFWDRLAGAEHACLVLDYDGTLAPFRVNRMEAFPLHGVVDLLTTIRDSGRTHLAIMTGRPMKELLYLLGDLGIPISASQGTEFRYPDGTWLTLLPTERQENRLRRAQEEAASVSLKARVERKVASVALHTRGMDPDAAKSAHEKLCEIWSRDAEEYNLECRHFIGGIEIRLRDIDKGTALRTLLDERPSDGLCVYAGDDYTDEDALKVLAEDERGIGIKVGSPDVPTYAHGRLVDPYAVREFLRGWIRTTT